MLYLFSPVCRSEYPRVDYLRRQRLIHYRLSPNTLRFHCFTPSHISSLLSTKSQIALAVLRARLAPFALANPPFHFPSRNHEHSIHPIRSIKLPSLVETTAPLPTHGTRHNVKRFSTRTLFGSGSVTSCWFAPFARRLRRDEANFVVGVLGHLRHILKAHPAEL